MMTLICLILTTFKELGTYEKTKNKLEEKRCTESWQISKTSLPPTAGSCEFHPPLLASCVNKPLPPKDAKGSQIVWVNTSVQKNPNQ